MNSSLEDDFDDFVHNRVGVVDIILMDNANYRATLVKTEGISDYALKLITEASEIAKNTAYKQGLIDGLHFMAM